MTRPGLKVRYALFATLAAAAMLLVWTGWRNVVLADQASEAIIRGRAEGLGHSVMTALRDSQPLRQEELESILESERGAGLRYLAVQSERGTTVESGTPLFERQSPPAIGETRPGPRPLDLRIEAGRVRLFARPLQPPGGGPRPSMGPPGQLQPGPPPYDRGPDQDGPPGPPTPPGPEGAGPRAASFVLTCDFVPTLAVELQAEAQRGLLASSLAAVVLLGIGMMLLVLFSRIERAEQTQNERRQLEKLGEMSAVMAHEIRNPLASLKGHAQLLVEQLEDGSPPKHKARRVLAETLRLEAMATNLLEFSKQDSATKAPASPLSVLERAAKTLDRARIDLMTERAPDTWTLDASLMQRAITNLLSNALQASSERIEAEAFVAGIDLVFEVRDRGEGLDEAKMAHMFEPFVAFRSKGTGLGLAITKRIVEQHGGTIQAASRAGGGTIMMIRLPRS